MPALDTLCLPGDISVADTVTPIGYGLTFGTNYQLKINGSNVFASGPADAGGYFLPGAYSSAIPGVDVLTLWDIDANPDVQVAPPWTVTWIAVNPGPPVTPAIPFKPYCPAVDSWLTQETDWIQIDWFPAIVCDAGRNDGVFYDVQRSTSGGPYVTIAANLTDLTYVDHSIVPGTTYNYRIRTHTTYLGGRIVMESFGPPASANTLLEAWGIAGQ